MARHSAKRSRGLAIMMALQKYGKSSRSVGRITRVAMEAKIGLERREANACTREVSFSCCFAHGYMCQDQGARKKGSRGLERGRWKTTKSREYEASPDWVAPAFGALYRELGATYREIWFQEEERPQ